MYYSIDYYSFTIPVRSPFGEVSHEAINFVLNAFVSFCNLQSEHFLNAGSWGIEKGSGFYSTRLRHAPTDAALSFGGTNAHIFVELAGKACNNFDAAGELDNVIRLSCGRTTRIDFAVDIECKDDPITFAAFRNSSSFKSSGQVISPSGRTAYVGSRKGERMARVYRYEPPHPRSHLLRVEAEYKGDAAKASSKHYLEVGIQKACLDAHTPFSWGAASWAPEDIATGKIPYKAYRPDNASTVRWLYGDVITALSKAVGEGLVDFDEWLKFVQERLK